MDKFIITATINITADVCPITFVKTKLQLEKMQKGEILEVILNDGEPLQNIPASVKGEGHKVLLLEKLGTRYRLLVERGE